MYNKKIELVIKNEEHTLDITTICYFEDVEKMQNFIDKIILILYPNAKVATLAYMGKNSSNGYQNWVLLPYEYSSSFGGMNWLLQKRRDN